MSIPEDGENINAPRVWVKAIKHGHKRPCLFLGETRCTWPSWARKSYSEAKEYEQWWHMTSCLYTNNLVYEAQTLCYRAIHVLHHINVMRHKCHKVFKKMFHLFVMQKSAPYLQCVPTKCTVLSSKRMQAYEIVFVDKCAQSHKLDASLNDA